MCGGGREVALGGWEREARGERGRVALARSLCGGAAIVAAGGLPGAVRSPTPGGQRRPRSRTGRGVRGLRLPVLEVRLAAVRDSCALQRVRGGGEDNGIDGEPRSPDAFGPDVDGDPVRAGRHSAPKTPSSFKTSS